MNLTNLKNIDLKELDVNELKEYITDHKDYALSVMLLLATVFFCFTLFSNSRQSVANLKNQLNEIENKSDEILQFENSTKNLKYFIEHFPQAPAENDMVELVTSKAQVHKVVVLSYSPAQEAESGVSIKRSMQFLFNVKDYKDLIGFINDLEATKLALRIDSWRGTIEGSQLLNSANGTDEKTRQMNNQLTLTAVMLNNNEPPQK